MTGSFSRRFQSCWLFGAPINIEKLVQWIRIMVYCTCTLILFDGQNGFGVIQFEILFISIYCYSETSPCHHLPNQANLPNQAKFLCPEYSFLYLTNLSKQATSKFRPHFHSPECGLVLEVCILVQCITIKQCCICTMIMLYGRNDGFWVIQFKILSIGTYWQACTMDEDYGTLYMYFDHVDGQNGFGVIQFENLFISIYW